MALTRPSDFAWIFIVFASIMLVAMFGLDSVTEYQGNNQTESLFTSINNSILNSTGLKGAADDQRSALVTQEGSGDGTSVDNFIIESFNSLRSLGKTYVIMEQSIQESSSALGIPVIFWVLLSAGLLITFAVILYTWIRGQA
jgi:lipopolysaccharide export LptBFGC system permease protein LptF